jgi:D-glycero-D-manno-heptose 1,7-bisphosphate phosphatase
VIRSNEDAIGRVWPLVPPGIWLDLHMAPRDAPSPALFLDRDGVVICDAGYIAEPAAVRLLPGAADLIGAANRAGIPALVVTNQSGIDRGLFDWNAFAAVEARINELLTAYGVFVDAVAACPFHPDHTIGYGRLHARWRKPGPGLLKALSKTLNIHLRGSWLVGDQERDAEAARRAGLAGALLIRQGSTEMPNRSQWTADEFQLRCVPSCTAAAEALVAAGLLPGAC